ncbi:acyltransferase family protein [Serratia grimesii]|uniref:acyltransferase family protein n=1 Tax=Serratia grimesii TaxID=82995 RepID=UPI002177D620|nr:acyltransferase [Serratia grimesii]CAI0934849.1 Acyltransferase family [Serratia grimesii]
MPEESFVHDRMISTQLDIKVKGNYKNKDPIRLEYIDSIRGIAAISVVIAHFIVPIYGVDRFLFSHLLDIGKIGVVLFFIISGFIIPFSFKRNNGGVKAFLISRFFRLYPGYWFSLFLFLVVSLFFGKQFPVGQILANMTMVQTALGVRDIVGVYWTLFIEIVFYFLCVISFGFGLLNRPGFNFTSSLFMLCCAIVMGIAKRKFEVALPVALPLALSLMAFGGLWRAYLLEGNLAAKKLAKTYIVIFLFVIPMVSFLSYGMEPGHTLRYTLTYYLSMLSFVLLTTRLKIKNKYMVFMGVISYSMYLIHPSLLIVYESLIADFSEGGRYFFGVIGVILTLPVSYLVYRFIELPSIKLGRKVKSHILNPKRV